MKVTTYMQKRFEKLTALAYQKEQEYKSSEHTFATLIEIAIENDLTVEEAIMMMASKHWASLKVMVKDDHCDIEKLVEKTGDIIIYMILLEAYAQRVEKRPSEEITSV